LLRIACRTSSVNHNLQNRSGCRSSCSFRAIKIHGRTVKQTVARPTNGAICSLHCAGTRDTIITVENDVVDSWTSRPRERGPRGETRMKIGTFLKRVKNAAIVTIRANGGNLQIWFVVAFLAVGGVAMYETVPVADKSDAEHSTAVRAATEPTPANDVTGVEAAKKCFPTYTHLEWTVYQSRGNRGWAASSDQFTITQLTSTKMSVEKASSILGKTLEIRWHPFQLNPEMPVEGLDRRLYRSAKFGSWEQSQRLDAQLSAAGTEVGIRFRLT
jgi:hypothetical protein